MDVKHIIVSVNMRAGEILTLEKAQERVEYEAFFLPSETMARDCTCYKGATYCGTLTVGS